jgi:hypothetical protein
VNFRNSRECEKDRQDLFNESSEIREIIESCNDILHVDNPPIPVIKEKDSMREKDDKVKEIAINEKKHCIT